MQRTMLLLSRPPILATTIATRLSILPRSIGCLHLHPRLDWASTSARSTTTISNRMSSFNEETSERVLGLWFPGFVLDGTDYPADPTVILQVWFRRSDEFDDKCGEFKPLLLELAASYNKSTITELAKSPRQALALVLLLDQLPRNCFRGDSIREVQERYDPLAQAVADYCTADGRRYDYGVGGIWRPYPPARVWFLMPYMHAESAQLQEEGARKAKEAANDFEGDQPLGKMLASSVVEYMRDHGEVISRFGRFPHRNRALGRQSTEAEEKWLSETKYSWAATD